MLPDGDMLMPLFIQPGNASTQQFSCLRLNENGELDKAFGDDGIATLDIGRGTATSVKLDGEGRIILAGGVPAESNFDMIVASLFADGSPDASFGDDGSFVIVPPMQPHGAQDKVYGIAIDTDNSIILGGFARSKERTSPSFAVENEQYA